MIDKDLGPIYQAMVKATYMPIIRRTIVILLIHDMDRMQAQTNTNDADFMNLIRSPDGKKALFMCLDSLYKRREGIIQEIILQYGINTSGTMTDFYHEQMHVHFGQQIDYVKMLIQGNRFERLDYIARTQPE